MRLLKRLLLSLAIVAVIFVGLNWGYFKAQVDFYLYPPQDQGPDQGPRVGDRQEAPYQEPDHIWIRKLGNNAGPSSPN